MERNIPQPDSGHRLGQPGVFLDKEGGGRILDYVGIITSLKQTMNDYTNGEKHNYGNADIRDASPSGRATRLSTALLALFTS